MRRWGLLVGLAGVSRLALPGGRMLPVFLPSHPDAAGIGAVRLALARPR